MRLSKWPCGCGCGTEITFSSTKGGRRQLYVDRSHGWIAFNNKLAALKDKPCMDCGKKFPPECMDFDHRPGMGKGLPIQRLAISPKYAEKLQEEIAKCDLVCACCHRIRTKLRGKFGYNSH